VPKPPEGLPGYGWKQLLELAGMATVTMLKRHRREPADGQKPVGYYWTGHDYALLYTAAEAVAMPPLSPGRQRRYDHARTCAECGARALDPFERGDDGQRYCGPCQGPVHERLWHTARAADRPVIATWAAGVLADPRVVLGGSGHHQFYRQVQVVDLAGVVLLDAKVRYYARGIDERVLQRPELADTVSPADLVDQVAALVGRRLVTWWPSLSPDLAVEFDSEGRGVPALVTAADDYLGHLYDRWVGKVAGSSYRYQPRLAHQPPPWEPVEQVTRMRDLLAEMATGEPTGAVEEPGQAPR